MQKTLKIAACVLVILLIMLVIFPFVVPMESMKNVVLARIEAATGRKVSIGRLSLSVYPDIALDAQDVAIGNPAWTGGAGDMVDMKTLRIGVELLPLLHKQVNIKELTLESPVITLVKNGAQANWQFSSQASVANAAPKVESAKHEPSQIMPDIVPDHISIKDGKLTYRDLNSGIVKNISDIALDLKAPNPEEKMLFEGSMRMDGKNIDLSLNLSDPLKLASGSKSNVDMKLAYDNLNLAWQGTLAFVQNAPTLTGKMAIQEINVAGLSGKKAGNADAGKPSAASAKTERWSSEPIAMTALNSADADLAITIEKLVLAKTTLNNLQLNVRLAHGELSAASNDVAAYGGSVRLALQATSSNKINLEVAVAGVKAAPLLTDFTGSAKVSGTLDAQVKLATEGVSQKMMVNALAGQGEFHFKDGQFKGVNLASVAHNIGFTPSNNDQSTNFSELMGTFTIANGIVTNKDLKMNSPLLRVSGEGTADLPNWQVQYLVQPKLVASADGQGGKDAEGITIPIRVEGSLDSPRYHPDMQAALKNVGNSIALKNAVKQLKGNSGNVLQGILR